VNANLANLSPVAIDLTYLDQLCILDRATTALVCAQRRLFSKFAQHHYAQGREWALHPLTARPFPTAYEDLQRAEISLPELTAYLIENGLGKAELAEIDAADEAQGLAVAACRETEDEYDRRPWARYWLVTSSDGHIHSSRHCCTCNKGKSPTRFALAAYLSGKPVSEAVADLGPALCSVCFPEAPVESKEQARIPARLALVLAQEGCEAFHRARSQAKAKAAEKASGLCQGAGRQGLPHDGLPHWHRCPVCGEGSRKTSTGKVRSHRAPLFYVEDQNWKCWTVNNTWGSRKDAFLFKSKGEAQGIACSTPGATVRTK
jgi:hypothetical protein